MNSSRYRIFLWAGLALVLLWGGVFGAYRIAEGLRPTPEKLAAYAGSPNFAQGVKDMSAALVDLDPDQGVSVEQLLLSPGAS